MRPEYESPTKWLLKGAHLQGVLSLEDISVSRLQGGMARKDT